MTKKSILPVTKVKNPEPKKNNLDWIIWAAWADRITFEEIFEKTGKTEAEVIKTMRKTLKPSSFRLWRKRVSEKSIKHRKLFSESRKKLKKRVSFDS
mgnify:CR=1 FL=1|jgi:uncharacterized protein (TIGR03643 family)|tara:strand:+ start:11685 stop:11975 length:291 start_codon:yes stop_codon:yes gene_type:complete